MNDTRTIQARVIKAQVFKRLGGRCAHCSTTADLQCHVTFDDGGAHHRFGSPKRWRFYLACAKFGDLILLCRTCHTRETVRLRNIPGRIRKGQ